MRKERAFIVRMHEHKKYARAFFVINSSHTATTPFILLAQSTVVVVCCSSLRSGRIFAPSISPCRSPMSMQQRQPLRSWFGASEARSCRSTYNASSVTQRYPIKDTYIRPPEFTSRLYKLPKQKIYCYSNYECYYQKDTATLINSFRFDAFNFGDPIDLQLSLWREIGGQRTNIKTGT